MRILQLEAECELLRQQVLAQDTKLNELLDLYVAAGVPVPAKENPCKERVSILENERETVIIVRSCPSLASETASRQRRANT